MCCVQERARNQTEGMQGALGPKGTLRGAEGGEFLAPDDELSTTTGWEQKLVLQKDVELLHS